VDAENFCGADVTNSGAAPLSSTLSDNLPDCFFFCGNILLDTTPADVEALSEDGKENYS